MDIGFNPFSLAGKTILITGASSGIGRTTAILCSKMGARVIITGRNEERLQETFEALSGDGHEKYCADLTVQEEVEKLVGSIDTIQGAVFCAGKSLTLPVLFSTQAKFKEIFDINFFSPVETFRLLVKRKKMAFGSSAVFIVSIGGNGKWSPGNGVYGASKAALNSMVHYFSIELAPKGIRVNGINPGMVETPMIHRGTLTQEQLEEDQSKYPLKRYGRPEDIAHGVIYLLSDASSWITGQSLVIDGGITAK